MEYKSLKKIYDSDFDSYQIDLTEVTKIYRPKQIRIH